MRVGCVQATGKCWEWELRMHQLRAAWFTLLSCSVPPSVSGVLLWRWYGCSLKAKEASGWLVAYQSGFLPGVCCICSSGSPLTVRTTPVGVCMSKDNDHAVDWLRMMLYLAACDPGCWRLGSLIFLLRKWILVKFTRVFEAPLRLQLIEVL